MTDTVLIYEVGPRDGLENEAHFVTTRDKIRLIRDLVDCGIRKIEVTSFVSPKWVPQMADAKDVARQLPKGGQVIFSALTPDMVGMTRALDAGLDEVSVFASASEAFSQKHVNGSIEDCILQNRDIVELGRRSRVPVRGYISCATDCPYSGPVAPDDVARLAKALLDMGCYQISLGDTIGLATPVTVTSMLDAVLDVVPADRLAGHFHDTTGTALENIAASLDRGLRVFDSAISGLGGCPHAPGAPGNVATDAVVAFLHGQGMNTGIQEDKLRDASSFAKTLKARA